MRGSQLAARYERVMSASQTTWPLELTPRQKQALVDRLRQVRGRTAPATLSSPLVRLGGPRAGRTPFFCVHAIGGAVFSYIELAQSLGAGQPFYGLQAPGLDGRSAPFEDLEEMAAEYVRALRTVQPEGPYRLGGWSFGGAVAFEMARQLREAGARVDFLALLDSWSPQLSGATEVTAEEVEDIVAHDLGAAAGSITPEQQERLLGVYQAHLRALHRYRPEPWLDESVFVTLFRATPSAGLPDAPANGWDGLILGDIEICQVPGDHYSMLTRPQVGVLAERLATRLGA
jgi:thioesterase domain-containing protein